MAPKARLAQTEMRATAIKPRIASARHAMAQIVSATVSKGKRRMLGFGLDFWNNLMVASLAFGALAAVVLGISTYVIIRLQKAETVATAEEFSRYKLATEKSISEANARAAEAQLALEKFKTPRSIPQADRPRLIRLLSEYPDTEAAVYILGEGPEPNALGGSITNLLNQARWKALSWVWSGAGSAVGVLVFSKPGSTADIEAICDALVAGLNSVQISAGKQVWPGDWDHFGGMLNGPNPPAPTAAPIRIVIGTKPL
jgi:hypothetical protein